MEDIVTKKCSKCGIVKPFSEFYRHKSYKLGISSWCRTCYRDGLRIRNGYPNPRPQGKTQKEWYKTKREQFLEMYGGKCACCGETEKDFLTIEHVRGQRGMIREGSNAAYRKSVKEYRPDLYEILCYNCNCAKGKLGYCPHNRV